MDNHMHHGPQDVGVHGMLLFGEQALYLSHLPMFMSMHDRQVILEVTLEGQKGEAQAIYQADRRETGERVYTLVPERFSLQRLGAEGTEALRTFQGTVHRGHFEKPGNLVLLKDVTVSVTNLIHFRKFDPEATLPSELQYLLFGHPGELYLAHWITRPPDFDQILPVSATGPAFTDDELRHGMVLTFSGRKNHISNRLQAGERATAKEGVTLEIAKELYLEEGELAEEVTFDTTPEEKAAGFS
jgi:hypothetical protein